MEPTVITNSERATFQSCRFRWLLIYCLGLHPLRTSLPLLMGTLWHEAMDAWWTSPWDQAWKASRERLGSELRKVREESATRGFSVSKSLPTWSAEELDDAQLLLEGMLDGYSRRWLYDSMESDLCCVGSELRVEASTLTKKCNYSRAARIAGTLDKLLLDRHGQYWIAEHKTCSASKSLSRWAETHEYNPQVLTYAYLLVASEITEKRPVGVIYDLALKALPPKPQDFRLADRGRRLSKVLPRHTTAECFREALRLHGFGETDHDWYQEKLLELISSEDQLFQRIRVRFRWDENTIRLGRELYQACMELRKAHRIVSKALPGGLHPWELESNTQRVGAAHDVASNLCGEFPRNQGACYRWSKVCDYIEPCRFMTRDSFESGLTIKEPHR